MNSFPEPGKNGASRRGPVEGPNSVPRAERIFNTVVATWLVLYGVVGVLHGKFQVSPPKSRIGLVLQGLPAWFFAAAIFIGAAVLLSVVVDHYDKRANEGWYKQFKQVATKLAVSFLLASLVLGFYVALTR